MSYGAGYLAAMKFGAAEIVDPRPYATGSIRDTFAKYPQIANIIPAVGYAPEQIKELTETIRAAPCDIVLIATPTDFGALLELEKEVIRVRYEIEETDDAELKGYIEGFLDSYFYNC
jgi:predicted GTPase